MAKQKERSELEYLRGQCRRLQSENRHLKRRNKQLETKKHIFESEFPRHESSIDIQIEDSYSCPDCGKGNVATVIEFRDKQIEACDLCTYRKVITVEVEDEI